jgi:hypothetical protein
VTATSVPRRHRRDNREAEQNLEDEFAALEHQAAVELAQRPTPPRQARVPLGQREMKPVLRPTMRAPRQELPRLAKVAANRTGHHAFRPEPFLCAAGRGARRGGRWARDYVKMPKRQMVLERLVADGDSKKHAKFAARYEQRRKRNLKRVAVGGGVALGAFLVAVLVVATVLVDRLGPWFGWPATTIVVVGSVLSALAAYGRESDPATRAVQVVEDRRPFAKPPETRPSPDLVHQAFDAAGIAGITVIEAPHREGPGWETLARIPVGRQSFATAVGVHDAIAGNLGVPNRCLILSPVRAVGGSEKHVRVWWSRDDPFAGDPPPHPVLDPRSGPHDPWIDGVRIGTDERGKAVAIPIVDTPFAVIVGRPRTGKTHALLGIGAELAADPLFDPDCWSFKASNDFAPIGPLVTAAGGVFRYGTDEATFKAFHRYLVELKTDIAARNERLADLPIDLNPHGRVERSVAADPANRMRPRPVIADEIMTPLADPKWGDPILAELKEIGRIAPSQNVPIILGMQYVDRDTIEQLDRLLGTRICLSVAKMEDSKCALGGAHEPGIAEAHKIPLTATGVAIVDGAIEDPKIGPRGAYRMRTYAINRTLLAAHVDRCLAGPRAGQQGTVQQAKGGDPAAEAFKARLRPVLNGDVALTCTALGERLELGEGPVAAKRLAEQARAAGIEPRKDTTGKATGSREALYIHRDQLN